MKIGLLTDLVVGGGVEVALVGDYLSWVVGPSIVRDVLGGVAELLERCIKHAMYVRWDVEFHLDVPDDQHTATWLRDRT